jgi:hypothetical protein
MRSALQARADGGRKSPADGEGSRNFPEASYSAVTETLYQGENDDWKAFHNNYIRSGDDHWHERLTSLVKCRISP